jgi:hypothetical protein
LLRAGSRPAIKARNPLTTRRSSAASSTFI